MLDTMTKSWYTKYVLKGTIKMKEVITMRKTTNYIILDTETATLPFVNDWNLDANFKKKIAIAKPLVYDIGWTIANRTHGIIEKRNYLVAETFSVPSVFNTAYYHEKRPLYLEMIERGEITVLPWDSIMGILINDLKDAAYICAYNAMFDFKKAITFTELYIRKLYSNHYYEWEQYQRAACKHILANPNRKSDPDFDPEHFFLRGEKYPMIDIWGIACKYLLNSNKYKRMCLQENKISNSGLYFSTNAEVAMQYLSKRFDFIEDHTALSDAEIETEILFYCLKRGKIIVGIEYFPFRMLGNTVEFTMNDSQVTERMAANVAAKIRAYLPEYLDDTMSRYQKATYNQLAALENFMEENWG